MIKACMEKEKICEIINEAAQKYKGRIPEDRWHEPYMSHEDLEEEIKDGVRFYGYYDPELLGVMGLQDRCDAALIRHAYVKPEEQKKGIGGRLIEEIEKKTGKKILVGTWKTATWAIDFYKKHGYIEVGEEEKNVLLEKYWKIPKRQIETSTVLVKDRHI